jgi:transposase
MDIHLPGAAADAPPVGPGFAVSVPRRWVDDQTGEVVEWQERVLVARSDKLARRQQHGLEQRLERAETALQRLRPRTNATPTSVIAQSQALLDRYRVGEYLKVTWKAHITRRKHYLKRGRHGAETPFEMVTETHWTLSLERQEEAIATFNRLAGWRLYASNAPEQRLSLGQAIGCYREQWQPEYAFRRLKSGAVAIRPLFLRSERRIKGLLRILVIALQALTLLEFVARRNLARETNGSGLNEIIESFNPPTSLAITGVQCAIDSI